MTSWLNVEHAAHVLNRAAARPPLDANGLPPSSGDSPFQAIDDPPRNPKRLECQTTQAYLELLLRLFMSISVGIISHFTQVLDCLPAFEKGTVKIGDSMRAPCMRAACSCAK